MRRSPQGSLFRGSGGGREGGAAGVHCISQHPGQVVSALEYECVYTCVCKCVCALHFAALWPGGELPGV